MIDRSDHPVNARSDRSVDRTVTGR